MKLYYSAGACSMSCHIALEESGLKYEAIGVDWDNASDPNLALVAKLNPLGTLPVLVLDSGKLLRQNVSILNYVAEQAPSKNLLPAAGTLERSEVMDWLSFVSSDLHKTIGLIFSLGAITPDKEAQAQIRAWVEKNAETYLTYLDQGLTDREYLGGKHFTIADAYCFVVTGWTKWVKIPTDRYKNLTAYMTRVSQRPAVQKVLKEEGLLD